ncbi:hypothetical protein E2C01_059001 [Portunus trituberculatus]|uniref:HTH psq-type domain-containing protein n=1 Tax=Portunus trituberculatus TaxID=210409 RepID=A0A5B7H4W9_PORTR|nr:hypothetical protein [Portunus trituberculatus]
MAPLRSLHFILANAPKCPTPSTPCAAKKRKVLSLAQKMEVIESVEGSLGWTKAVKKFGLHKARQDAGQNQAKCADVC